MPHESFDDYEHDAVDSVARLRDLYGDPIPAAVTKVTDRIDEVLARFVRAATFVVLGSRDPQGGLDVTPRGGPPGFVAVLGDRLLAMPDAPGNRRLDTLQNVVQTGRVGALFLAPGRSDTVRVNGRAQVTVRPDLLARLAPVGRPPRAALLIEPEEAFVHCPRALRFAGLGDGGCRPDPPRG